jgi:hypothetical protein
MSQTAASSKLLLLPVPIFAMPNVANIPILVT